MFEKCYDAQPNFKGVPFHSLDDREYWEKLRPYAERVLTDYPKEIAVLPASRFMDFWYNGNRTEYEKLYFGNRTRLKALSILEAVKNDGKLLPDIIDSVWAILDEATWCLPAHNGFGVGSADALPDMDDYVLDLFQAETGALLAEVYYLFKDKFDEYSKNINKRLVRALYDRIINPFIKTKNYDYKGLDLTKIRVNNWNPWIISNVLFMALVLEEGSVVQKAARAVDMYVKTNPEDGGCDEGPNYWFKAGAKLVDAANYLECATGIKVTDSIVLKNFTEYNMKVNLFDNVYTTFADTDPRINYIASYYRAAQVVGSQKLMDFGCHVYHCLKAKGEEKALFKCALSVSDAIRFVVDSLEAIASFEEVSSVDFVPDESYWLESVQVKIMHKGAYDVAIKGGDNAENHNHNDVGNFILAKDKELFIIDTGWMDYCKDTFNENRYTIWVNQSQYHNLPEIDGKGQKAGREYAAKDVVSTEKGFCADISLAYGDENVSKWVRNLEVCEDGIVITEDFEYQNPADAVLHLMTQFEPKKEDYGLSLVSKDGKKMEVHFEGNFTFDTISTGDDKRLNTNWGKVLYRINIPVEKTKSAIKKIKFI